MINIIVPCGDSFSYSVNFTHKDYAAEEGVPYYYLRIIQENEHIGWSSPLWLEA